MTTGKSKKKKKDGEQLILDAATKEVNSWPLWKRKQLEALFKEDDDTHIQRCRCGFADCNNRGY